MNDIDRDQLPTDRPFPTLGEARAHLRTWIAEDLAAARRTGTVIVHSEDDGFATIQIVDGERSMGWTLSSLDTISQRRVSQAARHFATEFTEAA